MSSKPYITYPNLFCYIYIFFTENYKLKHLLSIEIEDNTKLDIGMYQQWTLYRHRIISEM